MNDVQFWVNLILTILAILISPIVGLWVGTVLDEKQKRKDVLRRIIGFSHELHQIAPTRVNILQALLEVKFWYAKDRQVIDLWMDFQRKSALNQDNNDEFYNLIQLLAKKEKIKLSKQEIIAGLNGK